MKEGTNEEEEKTKNRKEKAYRCVHRHRHHGDRRQNDGSSSHGRQGVEAGCHLLQGLWWKTKYQDLVEIINNKKRE